MGQWGIFFYWRCTVFYQQMNFWHGRQPQAASHWKESFCRFSSTSADKLAPSMPKCRFWGQKVRNCQRVSRSTIFWCNGQAKPDRILFCLPQAASGISFGTNTLFIPYWEAAESLSILTTSLSSREQTKNKKEPSSGSASKATCTIQFQEWQLKACFFGTIPALTDFHNSP